MQQLSGQDASFIYSERPHAPTHITSISIYDPSTAPGGEVSFTDVLDHLAARLHLARAFRQKIVRVPGDLDHPYWIEDAEFDLEYHVRQIALPRPGDWRQFCVQTARLHARPLDLSKPLWELYVIEGLDEIDEIPDGCFGFVLKVHHAAVDGKSGVEMITAIHGQSADVLDPPPPVTPWQPESEPSPLTLYARAWMNSIRVPGRAVRLAGRLTPGLGRAAAAMRANDGAAPAEMAPGTRFSGPVTPHRVLDARTFPFAALRPMRDAVPGATVNDVALAVIGGAMRAYLDHHGELPATTLRAMTPVSVRTESERADLGNQVSAMIVSLATDVADPVERLAAVHRSTSGSKEVTEAIGARNLTELSQLAPGLLIGVGTRLSARFARRGQAGVVNTVVTNVPGPREPLYFAGAMLLRTFGAGPVADGMGIINIVGSYDDQFVLSFTACRELMPDPERYADAIETAFHELEDATRAGGGGTPAVTLEYRPLTADLREAAAAFAARIPERDRGFLDRFLLYEVAVAGWTQATPARRIVALDGAEVVGLVTVEPQRGWMAHVGDFRVVVQPDARRTGVGAGLIDRGVELAQSIGIGKLSVEVMASNEGGLGLFERHGFEREAVLRRHVRDGDGSLQDLVVLARELPGAM